METRGGSKVVGLVAGLMLGLGAAAWAGGNLTVTGRALLSDTGSASHRLHVVAEPGDYWAAQFDGSAGLGTLVHLYNANSSTAWNIGAGGSSGWSNSNFTIDQHGVGPRLVISNAGSVGIGTNSPQRKLHVAGTADYGSNSIFISDGNDRPSQVIRGAYPELNLVSSQYSNTGHGPTLRFAAYDDYYRNSWKHWVIGTAGGNATFLDFGFAANQSNPHNGISDYPRAWGDQNLNNGFTVMRLTNAGRVGIGTQSPQGALHVAGDRLRLSTPSNGSRHVELRTNGAVLDLATAGAALSINHNGPDVWINANSGNLGVGTTSPTSKLTVGGSIAGGETTTGWVLGRGAWGPDNWLRLTTTQAGSVYHDLAINQLWSAGALRFSDQRAKRDIHTVEDALAKVMALRGVTYRWREPARGDRRQLGVVAQEVEKVLPELVATGPDGLKGVAYDQMAGLFIEAIKAQQSRIRELEVTTAQLMKRLDRLEHAAAAR